MLWRILSCKCLYIYIFVICSDLKVIGSDHKKVNFIRKSLFFIILSKILS